MPQASSRHLRERLVDRACPRAQPRLDSRVASAPIGDQVPWDSPGVLEVGFEIPPRYNASDVLFQNLKVARGERLAATGPAGARTFSQLCADANRWGNALLSLGLRRGDRVLLFLDDTPIYPAAFFGAVRAGLAPLLINLLTPPDDLQFYLANSAAKVAIAEAAFSDRFTAGCKQSGLQTLIIVNGEPSSDAGVEIRRAGAWLATFSAKLDPADTHRDDMAFWMYSSGSTGRPKGIIHLQHDMAYTARSYARQVLKLTPNDICFSVPKIFFSYGFGNSITFPYSAGAASVLLPGQPKPETIFAAIAQYRPTVFFGLPTLYTTLTNGAGAEGADFSSLRLAISAAEILSAEVFNAWKSMTGLEIVEGLGSTEALNVYLSNTPERKKLGAAGMRVPGYELVLKDQDGNDVAEDREGILWVRGHANTPGYWNRAQKTRQTIRPGGWICTGDRFVRDRDGFYFFRGRGDDLIKISGQWVHPLEVQLCLADHPMVRECAVVAVEMPDRRMRLEAFIAMNANALDPEEATRILQDHVKQKLLPHKYPRVIHFLPDLPKTGTGKIDRQELRNRAAEISLRRATTTKPSVEPCSTDASLNHDPPYSRGRNVMKFAYSRHLQPTRFNRAGADIVHLNSARNGAGQRVRLLAGFAAGDMSELGVQLFTHWLARRFGGEFLLSSRSDGNLAFEAFRDKLTHNLPDDVALAVLIGYCDGRLQDPRGLFRLVTDIEQIPLRSHGVARAILNRNLGRAQVLLDGVPGCLEFISKEPARTKRPRPRKSKWIEASAWYALGLASTSPADITDRLSRAISHAAPKSSGRPSPELADTFLASSPPVVRDRAAAPFVREG